VELILKSTFFAPPTWASFGSTTSQVGAADNPLKRFGVEPIQNDFLASNTKWYLQDNTKALKPLLMIVRDAVRTVPRMNENDPVVFDTHMFQWGQWARMGFGWNFPYLMSRSGP
jgi:phage major head subunit gpT-like protein